VIRRSFLVVGMAVVSGCGGARSEEHRAPAVEGQEPASATDAAGDASLQTGRASYYADSLAGRPTASGEPYDPKAFTAAHRTLPLGSIVDVSRSDGRVVRVRINDRGPFGDEHRIVDLSRHAASDLGILRSGVADVTLRVVVLGKPRRRRHH
jgi:rare lipoprotein A